MGGVGTPLLGVAIWQLLSFHRDSAGCGRGKAARCPHKKSNLTSGGWPGPAPHFPGGAVFSSTAARWHSDLTLVVGAALQAGVPLPPWGSLRHWRGLRGNQEEALALGHDLWCPMQ